MFNLRSFAKAALQSSFVPGKFVAIVPFSDKFYLTFDDGPDPIYTVKFLSLLEKSGAKATFFLVGAQIERYPDIARQIVAAGHAVGLHTMHHQTAYELSGDKLIADLNRNRATLLNVTGIDTNLFRPVRGLFPIRAWWSLLGTDYIVVHWSKCHDDCKPDREQFLIRRLQELSPTAGDILCLHDNNQYTLAALDSVLPLWESKGLISDSLKL